MYADLLRYYQVDLTEVVAGRGPRPALVLALVEALPDDSATMAAMRGGREWRGWTKQTSVLSDVFDAINANTRATGRWKRRPPTIPPYPRPEPSGKAAKKTGKRRGQSIADVRRAVGMPQLPPQIPQPKTK